MTCAGARVSLSRGLLLYLEKDGEATVDCFGVDVVGGRI
jgi:hypothetical protein